MKARIINTPVEVEVQPYFNEGMFAGFTDVSGSLQPGMVVYKPSDLEFIDRPAPLKPIVDWSAFRREAAKDLLCAVLSGGISAGAKGFIKEKEEVIQGVLEVTDELIKQLKEDKK